MLKFVCLFLCMFFLLTAERAYSIPATSPAKKNYQIMRADSSRVNIRSFNNSALKEYAKQNDFKYDGEAYVQNVSLWSRFWHWVWRILGNIFDKIFTGKPTWVIFRIALFIIAAGAIAFIVFKILGIDVIKLFKGQSKTIDIPYSESLENIHEISFDDEIEKAVSNHNYRLAVRLLYLKCLKQLNDAQLIHWQIDKTNSAYLNELTDDEKRQSFGMLTRQFEYVWYGDFPVDGQAFQNINLLFRDFKQLLS
jgi:hypothetical protein